MANCLMQINQCGFPNCGQHFANQYDLTAHIEYTHIPMIEEETKRKAQLAAAASSTEGETPAVPVTNNLPLSYYSRVFRTAYRPNPIKPEPMKVSFNHYKKRALREKAPHPNTHIHKVYRDMLLSRGRNKPAVSLEDIEKRLGDVDFDECGPDNNEVRFRCHIVDCNKRYKNMFALRMHMKMLHSVVISEDAKSLTNFPSEDVKPSLSSLHPQPVQQQGSTTSESSSGSQSTGLPMNPASTPQQQVPSMPQFGNPATTPTSYKCTYCTKRYKTSSGLSNHMMASHQKISDAQDAPSPQVVEQLISQVRMQRQQQEANSLEQKNGQLTAQQQLSNGSSVRSYTVTTTPQPLRFNQQHYPVNLDNQPSTGQVLQMHMQQQRRMKQLQEQQAAAAAAAAAQQQQQQQQQAQQMQSQGMSNQQGYAPPPQTVGSPMGPPMQQQPLQQLPGPAQQQQQALPSLQPPSQQQYQQMPPPQQHQQNSSFPPQMHQMQSHYQQNAPYPQQSPQFPPYQQQSPQGPPPPGPPQRSPIPLSQALPPLNSMTQRAQLPPLQPPNAVPMHLSPPNQQGYDMMTSPPSGQQMAPPPPPYNL